MRHSTDKEAFAWLIGLAMGQKGAVTIGASFHPYQLVNAKGVPVWAQTMIVIITQQFCDLKVVATTNTFFHMNPPGPQAFPTLIWPDNWLATNVTPAFAKYVPFVIPFVDYDDGEIPYCSDRLIRRLVRPPVRQGLLRGGGGQWRRRGELQPHGHRPLGDLHPGEVTP